MKKIIAACDSFKGCLSSAQVNTAVAEGVKAAYPEAEVVCVPVADGGEGTVEALHDAFKGSRMVTHTVLDPLGRPIEAQFCILPDGTTAILETAAAVGLTLLKAEERNPMITSSYGLGQQIAHAVSLGCKNIIVGLGGSATNDAGTGMLQALGYKFFDREGREIEARGGRILANIAGIDASHVLPGLEEVKFTVLCDVTTTLTGQFGATSMFARQKGADLHMLMDLECGMLSYAPILNRFCRASISDAPGAGAAGGLGAAFIGVLKAEYKHGIYAILDMLKFKEIIAGADLIITGEGSTDFQTLFGKVPAGIVYVAKRMNIPVISIAGAVEGPATLNHDGFLAVVSIQTRPLTLAEAMDPATAAANITQTVDQFIRIFNHNSQA